jgi:hypothetical protein
LSRNTYTTGLGDWLMFEALTVVDPATSHVLPSVVDDTGANRCPTWRKNRSAQARS